MAEGLGFGLAQSASLTMMLDRVEASSFGMVSALWSLAYDAAFGLGATGFGLVAGRTDYAAVFAIVAAVMLTAIAPARRARGQSTERLTSSASMTIRTNEADLHVANAAA